MFNREKSEEIRNGVLTVVEAILKEASILSCPDNKLNPLALNLIMLTALLSIFKSHYQCSNSVHEKVNLK